MPHPRSLVAVRLSALKAADRPEGYYEEVVGSGEVKGDRVYLTPEVYHRLSAKYAPTLPLSQRIKNFASSAAKHLAAGLPMCSQEEIDRRYAICQGCEFHKDGACLKCGCPLVREKKFISKLSWAHEECPVGKWGKADTGS